MADEDIFACIDRVVSRGPTADELRAATESAVRADETESAPRDARAATGFAPICAPRAHPRIADPSVESFLSDDEIARYERDISEIAPSAAAGSLPFENIVPTTFGLSGALSGVMFNESTIMPAIARAMRFPCIRAVCNYGDHASDDFARLVREGRIDLAPVEKAARARAKKAARACARPRKIQGNGTCFNSSVLFWIYSEAHRSVYKIRLFRTGKFGLPGTKPEMIRDILRLCRDSFIPMLRDILSPSAGPAIALTSISSIMKNYKWRRIMPEGAVLNLSAISERIRADSRARFASAGPSPASASVAANAAASAPVITRALPYAVSYVQYGICDAKLSVKFNTPAQARTDKTIKVNVFPSGKINILGAHDSSITKNICDYLVAVITDDMIVAREGGASGDEMEESDPECEYSDGDAQ